MMKILDIFKSDFTQIVAQLLASVKSVFDYLSLRKNAKIKKEEAKTISKQNKNLKDICDKGTLEELLRR